MKIPTLPFTVTDWSGIAPAVHLGETGQATWRTFTIGDLAAQQPILDQLGQCASRLGIMLPSPGEEIGQIDHRGSFGRAAAINSPARATARPGAIGAAKAAPFSA